MSGKRYTAEFRAFREHLSLAGTKDRPHAIQVAWTEVGVPQCCNSQSGQIMSAAAGRRECDLLRDRQARKVDAVHEVRLEL